jgi:glutathione S-transferase
MLELYHSVNSVCAQKVRIVFKEKGLQCQEHLMTLAGDQYDPAYLKLNPNGVVPTVLHDGKVITESSVILYYLDETFRDPPLMPRDPYARATVRLYNKLIDEYVHNSCAILSFATAFRARLARLTPEAREAELSKAPLKKRTEFKLDVTNHGLNSHFVAEAVDYHEKLLTRMEESLQHGQFLAGDGYSLAEAAIIPSIFRLEVLRLPKMWDRRPRVAAWWDRMRQRSSTETAILKRMTDADWAPFTTFQPDPWPKVRGMVAAA